MDNVDCLNGSLFVIVDLIWGLQMYVRGCARTTVRLQVYTY